jgi:hypothetical protein
MISSEGALSSIPPAEHPFYAAKWHRKAISIKKTTTILWKSIYRKDIIVAVMRRKIV